MTEKKGKYCSNVALLEYIIIENWIKVKKKNNDYLHDDSLGCKYRYRWVFFPRIYIWGLNRQSVN